MPATSSRRRRRRRHRGRRRSGGGGVSERDWAELPHDVLLAVFGKLDHLDVLAGAGQVCRSWRRAARDEPSLYRSIHIHDHRGDRNQGRNSFARAIIRRAAGQCEAFSVCFVGDDRLLRFVADQYD